MTGRLRALVVKADAGTFEAIISTESLDRDKERLAFGCFEPLPERIPVHAYHRRDDPVGAGRPFYAGAELRLSGRFAGTARAQEVRELVKSGALAFMSVGFLAGAWTKGADGERVLTSGELLEASFVSIPSNRDARIVAVRGLAGEPWRARLAADRAQADLLAFDAKQLELQALDRLLRDCRRTIRDWDRALSRRDRRVPAGFDLY